MKFGKRLLAEAARKWAPLYLDYKLLKRSLKKDCANCDASGACFGEAMMAEFAKVGVFYQERESQLQKLLAHVEQLPADVACAEINKLRLEAQELTKYAVLNYMAAIKAIKKRNKRLREVCGSAVVTIQAFDVLQYQPFFYSRTLSQVATAAAILEEKLRPRRPRSEVAREYECPICLELLHAPVVLTCCHRFCWGCITAHCAGVLQALGNAAAQPPQACAKEPDTVMDTDEAPFIRAIELPQLHPGFEQLMEAHEQGGNRATAFDCPMCRKTQILDVEHLTVDHNLNAFVEQLRARRACENSVEVASTIAEAAAAITAQPAPVVAKDGARGATSAAAGPTAADAADSCDVNDDDTAAATPTLLPPQEPRWLGKLCIVLDLDGTLISSFPPRRAPRLPDSVRTHLVGTGSKLNPHGVFVVERPGLTEFLEEAQALGELVIFTAGLPDYARPIIAAIDPDGRFFGDRVIYREGTTVSPHYPCVKNLSRLGRDLTKTLLVDDTPLAFLQHPDNGIPVMSFRGDPDDNLLQDAVLPLLQSLSLEADIRDKLNARFGMASWFVSNGFPAGARKPETRVPGAAAGAVAEASAEASAAVAATVSRFALAAGPVLVCDFDGTLVDFNSSERITEVLAPELVPMLVPSGGGAAATDSIAVINAVLSELRNRGVSRERLLTELQKLGSEVPPPCVRLLTSARSGGAATLVLSGAAAAFVSNILQGAAAQGAVCGVVAHGSEFVRAASDATRACVGRANGKLSAPVESKLPSHVLRVSPCHPEGAPHACSLCAASMCKGLYLRALQPRHARIVFAVDGAENLCAVLCLRAADVALVRASGACANALAKHAAAGGKVACQVQQWESHERLEQLALRALQNGCK